MKRLNDLLKDINIELSDEMTGQFERYYELLIETNRVMNLTSITEKEDVMVKHFYDSLEIVRCVPDMAEKNYYLVDVGTGAGFPGIPLKIAFAGIQPPTIEYGTLRLHYHLKAGDMQRLTDYMDVSDDRKRLGAAPERTQRTHDIQREARDVHHACDQSAQQRYHREYGSYQAGKIDHQRLIQMVTYERIAFVAKKIRCDEAYPCYVRDSCYQISAITHNGSFPERGPCPFM